MNTKQYNTCVELYSDHLYRFMLKNIRNTDLAKDLVQMAFEVLWLNKENVEEEKAKSYLFTIGYRKMIDEIRKQQKIQYKDEINDSIGGYTQPKHFDLKKTLEHALNKLPDIQKQLILLKDYEGYSYEEMAQLTGLNEGQVKINLYRARTFLKNELISIDTHI